VVYAKGVCGIVSIHPHTPYLIDLVYAVYARCMHILGRIHRIFMA